MVRETRHLWVGNLPENIREDRIRDHFKRYGRVQSVKLLGRSKEDENGGTCATVSFMDIKSAAKAHHSEQKLEERTLTTEYHEPAAIPGPTQLYTSAPSSSANSATATTGVGSGGSGGVSSARFSSHGGSEDLSSSFERSSHFYERGERSEGAGGAYLRRSASNSSSGAYHSTESLSRSRPRDRLYRNGPYTPLIERDSKQRIEARKSSENDDLVRHTRVVSRNPTSNHHRVASSNWGYDSPSPRYSSTSVPSTTPELPYAEERRGETTPLVHKKHSKSEISRRSGSDSGSNSGSSASRSRSSSASSQSGSSTCSTASSPSSDKSCSAHSQQSSTLRGGGGSGHLSVLSSAPTHTNSVSPAVHSEDRRPLAICVRNLPARSSDTSLKDGLYHEYKKHGKVTWVKVVGQGVDRYALVCFKKADDVDKALQVSHDKLFFGCKIEVAPYQGYDVEDNEFRPFEAEQDEFHPKATRTLFIGNLEKDITTQEIRKHFDQFGEIIEIGIKKQGNSASYAFCQYADITSVVRAMRTLDGEHIGANRIKLGFGKSMHTNSVWVDGVSDTVSEKYLSQQFGQFGPVSHVVIDRNRGHALVFYEQIAYAQQAVKEMRGVVLRGRKLQVDYASRECQEAFYDRVEKQTSTFDSSIQASPQCSVSSGSVRVYDSASTVTATSPAINSTTRYNSNSSSGGSVASVTPIAGGAGPNRFPVTGVAISATSRSYQRPSASPTAAPTPSPRSSRHSSSSQRFDYVEYITDRRNYRSYEEPLAAEDNGPTSTNPGTGDIRHLQKERVALLEQLEDCAGSSGEETVANRRRCSKHRRSQSGGENSRPGTPLCDERPENLTPVEPRRLPRERPPDPLSLPLPRFASQVLSPRPPPPSPPASPQTPRSSSSDSEPSPPSPEWEERLRSLDEKYEKWSGSRTGIAKVDTSTLKIRHKLLDLDLHELQPSDIVKSVLAKRSVFDEDSKRLENFGEKYEPREFVPARTNVLRRLCDMSPLPSPVNKSPGLQYPFPSHPPPTTSSVPSTSTPTSTTVTFLNCTRQFQPKISSPSSISSVDSSPRPSSTQQPDKFKPKVPQMVPSVPPVPLPPPPLLVKKETVVTPPVKPVPKPPCPLRRDSIEEKPTDPRRKSRDEVPVEPTTIPKKDEVSDSDKVKDELVFERRKSVQDKRRGSVDVKDSSDRPKERDDKRRGSLDLTDTPVIDPKKPDLPKKSEPIPEPEPEPKKPEPVERRVETPVHRHNSTEDKKRDVTINSERDRRRGRDSIDSSNDNPKHCKTKVPDKKEIDPSSPTERKEDDVNSRLNETERKKELSDVKKENRTADKEKRRDSSDKEQKKNDLDGTKTGKPDDVVRNSKKDLDEVRNSKREHDELRNSKHDYEPEMGKPVKHIERRKNSENEISKEHSLFKKVFGFTDSLRHHKSIDRRENDSSTAVKVDTLQDNFKHRLDKKKERSSSEDHEKHKGSRKSPESREEKRRHESSKRKDEEKEDELKNHVDSSKYLMKIDKKKDECKDNGKFFDGTDGKEENDFDEQLKVKEESEESDTFDRNKENDKRKDPFIENSFDSMFDSMAYSNKLKNDLKNLDRHRKQREDQNCRKEHKSDSKRKEERKEEKSKEDPFDTLKRENEIKREDSFKEDYYRKKESEAQDRLKEIAERKKEEKEKRKERELLIKDEERRRERDSDKEKIKRKEFEIEPKVNGDNHDYHGEECRKCDDSDHRSDPKKEKKRDRWPATIGCKRRLSSQDSLEEDAKRHKPERRDSKDSGRSSGSSRKGSGEKHIKGYKLLEEKIKEDKEREQRKNDEIEPHEDSDKMLKPAIRKEKRNSGEKRKEERKFKPRPRENGTASESDMGSGDDEAKSKRQQHSIFDIVDDEPAYISMYDKVKARSTKNMQKQEEEKRQEKLKEKFHALKQSRAKREEKKRSTSYDEDSDSEKGGGLRRSSKLLLTSSEDDGCSENDLRMRNRKILYDTSEDDSTLHKPRKPITVDELKSRKIISDVSEDDSIKHSTPKVKARLSFDSESKPRKIMSDTSEDDTRLNAIPRQKIRIHSDESEGDLGFEDSKPFNNIGLMNFTPQQNHFNHKSEPPQPLQSSPESMRRNSLDSSASTEPRKKSHKKKQKRAEDGVKKHSSKKEKKRSHRDKDDEEKRKKRADREMNKRDEKLEDIFGPLSDDSEKALGKWQVSQVYGSDSDSERENMRKKEKKRREKKMRELNEAGRAIEAKLMDGSDVVILDGHIKTKKKKRKKSRDEKIKHHRTEEDSIVLKAESRPAESDTDKKEEYNSVELSDIKSEPNEPDDLRQQSLSSLLDSPPPQTCKKPGIPGFSSEIDENIHETAVKSISESPRPASDGSDIKFEEKPKEEGPAEEGKTIISQEETEDAVAALLMEGTFTAFDGYSEDTPKPDTPVSEPDLQIDTDTEDTFDPIDFSRPPRTPDIPTAYYIRQNDTREGLEERIMSLACSSAESSLKESPRPLRMPPTPDHKPDKASDSDSFDLEKTLSAQEKSVVKNLMDTEPVEEKEKSPVPMDEVETETPKEEEPEKPVKTPIYVPSQPVPSLAPLSQTEPHQKVERPASKAVLVAPEPQNTVLSPISVVIQPKHDLAAVISPKSQPVPQPLLQLVKPNAPNWVLRNPGDSPPLPHVIPLQRVPVPVPVPFQVKPGPPSHLVQIKGTPPLVKTASVVPTVKEAKHLPVITQSPQVSPQPATSPHNLKVVRPPVISQPVVKPNAIPLLQTVSDDVKTSNPPRPPSNSAMDKVVNAPVPAPVSPKPLSAPVNVIKAPELRPIENETKTQTEPVKEEKTNETKKPVDENKPLNAVIQDLTMRAANKQNLKPAPVVTDTVKSDSKPIEQVVRELALRKKQVDLNKEPTPEPEEPAEPKPQLKDDPVPIKTPDEPKVDQADTPEKPVPLKTSPKEVEKKPAAPIIEKKLTPDRKTSADSMTDDSPEAKTPKLSKDEDRVVKPEVPTTPVGRGGRGGRRKKNAGGRGGGVSTRRTRLNNAAPTPSTDVYEFRDDSEEETGRPRLILTIKSPPEPPPVQNKTSPPPVIATPPSPPPVTPAPTTPLGTTTRKSRRLQEKDGSRNTVDDTIDDVIRGRPGRRATRSTMQQLAPPVETIRKSPRRKQGTVAAAPPPPRTRSQSPAAPPPTVPTTTPPGPLHPVVTPQPPQQQPAVPAQAVPPQPQVQQTTPVAIKPFMRGSVPTSATGEPTKLIDPVTGLLIPMRESEEGQYIPVGDSRNTGGNAAVPIHNKDLSDGEPPEKRVRLTATVKEDVRTAAPVRPTVVRPTAPQPVSTPPLAHSQPAAKMVISHQPIETHAAPVRAVTVPSPIVQKPPQGMSGVPTTSVLLPPKAHLLQAVAPNRIRPPVNVAPPPPQQLPKVPTPMTPKAHILQAIGNAHAKEGIIGSPAPHQVLTGSVGSPPLRAHQQPIVTGAGSTRVLVKAPPNEGLATTRGGDGKCIVVVTPSQGPPGPRVVQPGIPLTAYEASLHSVVAELLPNPPWPRQSPPPAHQHSTQQGGEVLQHHVSYPHHIQPAHYVHPPFVFHQPAYIREPGIGAPPYHRSKDLEERASVPGVGPDRVIPSAAGPMVASPPLELRRGSPHDRTTDSPQVANVYVHGSGRQFYFEGPPPPPAHRPQPPPQSSGRLQVATPPHASQVPPQADSLLMLLQRYPLMWQGLLALKTDQAAVQMHFVFGNPQVAQDSLPCNSDGSTPPLRIAQRMRLEQTQVEGVARKMQMDNEHCMLLALPCGCDHMDVLQQSQNLKYGFITYLQQKQAAGIVNIAAPGSQQAAYVVHIFPSCDFANESLARIAPDLLHRVADLAHLLIVIATV